MSTGRIAAIVLIVAGVLALSYGGFTYTKETHEVHAGPLDLTVKDKKPSVSRSGQESVPSASALSCS